MNNTSYFTDAPTFETALNSVLKSINEAYLIYWKTMGFTYMGSPEIRISSIGSKFLKLSKFENRNGDGVWIPESVYCFIDLNNGNVHKAASWKAPETSGKTKGVRTNIFDADCLNKLAIHGTSYIQKGIDQGSIQVLLNSKKV